MSTTVSTPEGIRTALRAAMAAGMTGWSESTSNPLAPSYDARDRALKSWAVGIVSTTFTDPRRRTVNNLAGDDGVQCTTTAVVRLLVRNTSDAQRAAFGAALDAEALAFRALAAWNPSGLGQMVLVGANRTTAGDDSAYMVEITLEVRHRYRLEAP